MLHFDISIRFAYIIPVAPTSLLKLTTTPITTLRRFFRRITCFAAIFLIANVAWCADESPTEPEHAFEKIQQLTDRASELAMRAMGMLGTRYKFGGTTPESGLDCSGLVRHVFKESWGAILPRTAAEISRVGEHIEQKDLKPGDLVFYNTLKRGFSHVGIYLGDNRFIHAPSGGGEVRIDSMNLAYWKQRFNGARRMKDPELK